MGGLCISRSAWGESCRSGSACGGLCVGVCVQGDTDTSGYKGKSTLLVREPETFKHQAGTLSKFVLRGGIKIQLWGKLAKKKHNKGSFSLHIRRQLPQILYH